jgi:probable rRNA maturation factor
MGIMIELQIDDEYVALVDGPGLEAVVSATLERHRGVLSDAAELTLVVTGDEAVQVLNREFRGINAPTDVLSFAAQESLESAPDLVLPPELAAEMDRHLGDVVIAYPYAERQAQQFGNSIAAELRLLAIHGTLHLLGFEHATPDEEEVMWAEQEAILAPLGEAGMARRAYTE